MVLSILLLCAVILILRQAQNDKGEGLQHWPFINTGFAKLSLTIILFLRPLVNAPLTPAQPVFRAALFYTLLYQNKVSLKNKPVEQYTLPEYCLHIGQ